MPTPTQQANERLWAAHPELSGRALTSTTADAELRREWMRYYHEASEPSSPPDPEYTPAVTPKSSFPPAPPSSVTPCVSEEKCKDESGRICRCCNMSKITLYVQKGDSPSEIIVDSAGDVIKGEDMQPDTGHTFIGIGDGGKEEQEMFGFYPVSSWLGGVGGINTNEGFIIPGNEKPTIGIYDPENEHNSTAELSFKACPEAVENLKKSINEDIEAIKKNTEDAPKYNLAALQCTTWARGKLREIGFEEPGGFSPYDTAEAIDKAKEKTKPVKVDNKSGESSAKKK